jgi:hypothetical protein
VLCVDQARTRGNGDALLVFAAHNMTVVLFPCDAAGSAPCDAASFSVVGATFQDVALWQVPPVEGEGPASTNECMCRAEGEHGNCAQRNIESEWRLCTQIWKRLAWLRLAS